MKEKFWHETKRVGQTLSGEEYVIKLAIPMRSEWIDKVKLWVINGNEKISYDMKYSGKDDEYAYFMIRKAFECRAKEYNYVFSYRSNGNLNFIKRFNMTDAISLEESWRLYAGFRVPRWAKGKVMYHIFVDKYRRGSKESLSQMDDRVIHEDWYEASIIGPSENGNWNVDFHGGDIKGIDETLKYLKKLDVSIIYLSPICESQSNHRYDTADYTKLDPYVGNVEDLKKLCMHAKNLGISIILDEVFNHTGNDSLYFNQFGKYDSIGAFQSRDSIYYPFYARDEQGNFTFWWGNSNLPVCDKNGSAWPMYILGENGIIDLHSSWGFRGYRYDVADDLSDEFIYGINVAVRRNIPDAMLWGEIWKNPMRQNRGYVSSGKGLYSIMNYFFVDGLMGYFKYADLRKLGDRINEIMYEYPYDTVLTLMNSTSTHDTSRLIERFACDEFTRDGEWAWSLSPEKDADRAWQAKHFLTGEQYRLGKKITKAYIFALAFWPGVFTIFYGDEVGVRGIGNLANRAPYPWKKRDKDLLKFFRRICKARSKEKFLETAETKVLSITNEYFAFERFDEEKAILVVVSRVDYETKPNLPDYYENAEIVCKLGASSFSKLAPYGAVALVAGSRY